MDDGGAERSLADDEADLADLSREFHQDLVGALPGWVAATVAAFVERPLREDEQARVAAVGAEVAARLDEPLRSVLTADVDAGAGSPLALVRGVADTVSALLEELGVEAGARDPFAESHFPDDRHGVGPASFSDIDEGLQHSGIVWGAARAHVHLRRRRERDGR